jgi:hypothetical protein
MGLDSVEIVIGWEKSFGINISNTEAEKLRTPKQSIDLITKKLRVSHTSAATCLSARAFYHLRRAILGSTALDRKEIVPHAQIRELFPRDTKRSWETVRVATGFQDLPSPGWFQQHHTVADFSKWIVLHYAHQLKQSDEPWSYHEIRYVVRAVVTDVCGAENFSDEADFVRDIGIG